MQFLLDITWSPDGKYVTGTLRPVIEGEGAQFSGTLEFMTRIEKLLSRELSGEGEET